MQKWLIFWSPEGRPIKEVEAKDEQSARKKTPLPYKKYMGEVYVQRTEDYVREYGNVPNIFN